MFCISILSYDTQSIAVYAESHIIKSAKSASEADEVPSVSIKYLCKSITVITADAITIRILQFEFIAT